MMRLLLALATSLTLSGTEIQAASIFDPAKNPEFCPKDFTRVVSGMNVSSYPGQLPDRLDQDFSKYRNIYQGDIDNYLHAYSEYIMLMTAMATWSDEASDILRAEIIKNARLEPLKYNAGSEGRPTFHVILVMAPITIAYAQHTNEYSQDERDLIESWIKKKLSTIMKDSYLGSVDTDNKKYFIGVWLAAFAKATGEPSYLKKAISIYKKAIDKQRKDGSLKHDSQRGGSAIHYTNQAVMGLVTLAEMLTEAGFDAYEYQNNGRSIHTIIKFLLDATEDPTLISGYASDPEWSKASFPGYSADNQALDWVMNQNAVWAHYYLIRFGETDIGRQLRAASPFVQSRRMAVHANAGGNPACYLGKLP